ncbi:hypothetical protein M758_4G033700 [Ceratodon purpureus]|uniref:Uncharacterized protein n=1 Tax=Ceratodon purpureus TaxID=3225 RepID=A0A8T0I564_CERPU|nr:hypothetical protein KC19_4G036800 [Ceratodon purpureus]KAG0618026.1 hypothetical protein M758_4G033700 [Ceratodon purpureus]
MQQLLHNPKLHRFSDILPPLINSLKVAVLQILPNRVTSSLGLPSHRAPPQSAPTCFSPFHHIPNIAIRNLTSRIQNHLCHDIALNSNSYPRAPNQITTSPYPGFSHSLLRPPPTS